MGYYMNIDQTDPRLAAADLTRKEFIGEIVDSGHATPFDDLVEEFRKIKEWTMLQEHQLLEPRDGYVLRYNFPSDSHCVYLLHDNVMVGFFYETDTLFIHSEHRGKGLGKELILAAFAQKPWRDPKRPVSIAGRKTLERAYSLVCQLKQ